MTYEVGVEEELALNSKIFQYKKNLCNPKVHQIQQTHLNKEEPIATFQTIPNFASCGIR